MVSGRLTTGRYGQARATGANRLTLSRKVRAGKTVAALALALVFPVLAAAESGCEAELKPLRAQIKSVHEERRGEELKRLLEKAEKDVQNGRERLCRDAVRRMRSLLS